MTNLPVYDAYFHWLYSHIGSTKSLNYTTSYTILAEFLHRQVFTWYIPHDDNRADDGIFLRTRFLDEYPYKVSDRDVARFEMDACSVLEMMIALAERILFVVDSDDGEYGCGAWFWELANNIGLSEFTDEYFIQGGDQAIVEERIRVVMDRKYDSTGAGGLFPLQTEPSVDMRDIELWYQMNLYLAERYTM